jgi:hypothetical protein
MGEAMADQDMLHTAELVKAALPFVDTKTKVIAELFVKVFELMGSMKSIKGSSNMAACGFEASKMDLEGLLNGIRPLCNLREIEIVDQILNIFKMKKMFEMYNNLMETMKTMQEFGGFPFGDSGGGADTDTVAGNFGGSNFESIFQTLKGFSTSDTAADSSPAEFDRHENNREEAGDAREKTGDTRERTADTRERTADSNSSSSEKNSNDMMFEMLKTMIPADKVSTFENLSMLLNTMSYDSSSKPEQKERSDG